MIGTISVSATYGYIVKSDNDGRYLIEVTIGRIYSQHETYEVFLKMWPRLWETIAHITKTEVKFKFIDGEGLKAILVDGNKPQANALGAYLVNRNRPHLSGIHERSPKLILPNILRTCVFHLYRSVLGFCFGLAKYCTDATTGNFLPWR